MPKRPKPVVLIILDGWGVAPAGQGNALTGAATPRLKELVARYPALSLRASGNEVGLSWGEMGNSEVGHLTIGAGRIFYQTLPRINKAIEDGIFFQNSAFLSAMNGARKAGVTLHLVGLVSQGRVHAMESHLQALLELAKRQKVKSVAVHVILDGRDTVYNSGPDFVTQLLEKMKALKTGKIATLMGRYYAMDRDRRWDRTEKAYRAMVFGEGERATDPIEALKASYAKEVFDEQFLPTIIEEEGKPVATVGDGDAMIFFNFRPDRARQLTQALVLPDFDAFPRSVIKNLSFVTMVEYEKDLPVTAAFPPETIERPLGRVLSEAGCKQLHIAETEKYAHVTYFFNGTREEPFSGEDRVIIPSPPVAAYDTVPEMSAHEITKRVVKEIDRDAYDFMVVNFANSDMVAHTGNLEATRRAAEAVDEYVGKIVDAAGQKGGVVLITADHGNAEELLNLQTGAVDKEHSTNPVPLIVVGKSFAGQVAAAGEVPGGDLSLVAPTGMLADVAPTILKIMNIPQPSEMTGQPLL
ncbi:2,3-bisphosphoglycerate-independent phosphoglycerate mutase [Candidatus Uhrbacteria bacterium]|nr:2,3-bisphosphoglycerate-independent phosphoglycerate mutase [Candidatus Uhrbacteria bacterium]